MFLLYYYCKCLGKLVLVLERATGICVWLLEKKMLHYNSL